MVTAISCFVAIGAAPIPNAGLVYLIIIMNAVNIPTSEIAFVLAVDWYYDEPMSAVRFLFC